MEDLKNVQNRAENSCAHFSMLALYNFLMDKLVIQECVLLKDDFLIRINAVSVRKCTQLWMVSSGTVYR